jgi:peptide/nickel transport system substrate-binding protein
VTVFDGISPRLGALLALLATGAAACGISNSSEDSAGAAGAAGHGQREHVVVTTSFTIDDLQPLDNGFWAPEFGYGELLMRPLPGGELEPWVLDELEQVDDTTWELTLPEGVRFQNGNPLDGAALAELMTWHLDNNPAVPGLAGAEVAGTADPQTVRLTTAVPAPNVPSMLGNEAAFILFDLATYEDLEDTPDDLVGAGIYTGPYEVVALNSEEMELAAVEGHHGGEQALESATVRFVSDEQSRTQAVQAEEADLALYPPAVAARQLEGRDDALFLVAPEGEATGGMQLFLNHRTGPTTDRDVRRAVQLALDHEAVALEVMNGLYDVSPGMYPASMPYASEMLATDQDAAEDLLDGTGWERDGDGTRERDGDELTLRLVTYPQQPDVEMVGVALQDQLRSVGIDLRLVEVDDINEALEGGDWDLAISMNSPLGMTGTDPIQGLRQYFHSDGERNFGGIDDPDLDALIDEVSVTMDEGDRHQLLRDVQDVVAEGAYGWWLAFKRDPVVAAPELGDYEVPVANLWMTHFE